MKVLLKIIITTLLVLLISQLLPGVFVANITTSFLVAIVLSLLNIFIKPLIVVFTLPITVFSLGLFLLVINALMIIACDYIVGGFNVMSFWVALLFSVILSVSQSLIFSIGKINK